MVTKLHVLHDVQELGDEELFGDLLLTPEASGLNCTDTYDEEENRTLENRLSNVFLTFRKVRKELLQLHRHTLQDVQNWQGRRGGGGGAMQLWIPQYGSDASPSFNSQILLVGQSQALVDKNSINHSAMITSGENATKRQQWRRDVSIHSMCGFIDEDFVLQPTVTTVSKIRPPTKDINTLGDDKSMKFNEGGGVNVGGDLFFDVSEEDDSTTEEAPDQKHRMSWNHGEFYNSIDLPPSDEDDDGNSVGYHRENSKLHETLQTSTCLDQIYQDVVDPTPASPSLQSEPDLVDEESTPLRTTHIIAVATLNTLQQLAVDDNSTHVVEKDSKDTIDHHLPLEFLSPERSQASDADVVPSIAVEAPHLLADAGTLSSEVGADETDISPEPILNDHPGIVAESEGASAPTSPCLDTLNLPVEMSDMLTSSNDRASNCTETENEHESVPSPLEHVSKSDADLENDENTEASVDSYELWLASQSQDNQVGTDEDQPWENGAMTAIEDVKEAEILSADLSAVVMTPNTSSNDVSVNVEHNDLDPSALLEAPLSPVSTSQDSYEIWLASQQEPTQNDTFAEDDNMYASPDSNTADIGEFTSSGYYETDPGPTHSVEKTISDDGQLEEAHSRNDEVTVASEVENLDIGDGISASVAEHDADGPGTPEKPVAITAAPSCEALPKVMGDDTHERSNTSPTTSAEIASEAQQLNEVGPSAPPSPQRAQTEPTDLVNPDEAVQHESQGESRPSLTADFAQEQPETTNPYTTEASGDELSLSQKETDIEDVSPEVDARFPHENGNRALAVGESDFPAAASQPHKPIETAGGATPKSPKLSSVLAFTESSWAAEYSFIEGSPHRSDVDSNARPHFEDPNSNDEVEGGTLGLVGLSSENVRRPKIPTPRHMLWDSEMQYVGDVDETQQHQLEVQLSNPSHGIKPKIPTPRHVFSGAFDFRSEEGDDADTDGRSYRSEKNETSNGDLVDKEDAHGSTPSSEVNDWEIVTSTDATSSGAIAGNEMAEMAKPIEQEKKTDAKKGNDVDAAWSSLSAQWESTQGKKRLIDPAVAISAEVSECEEDTALTGQSPDGPAIVHDSPVSSLSGSPDSYRKDGIRPDTYQVSIPSLDRIAACKKGAVEESSNLSDQGSDLRAPCRRTPKRPVSQRSDNIPAATAPHTLVYPDQAPKLATERRAGLRVVKASPSTPHRVPSAKSPGKMESESPTHPRVYADQAPVLATEARAKQRQADGTPTRRTSLISPPRIVSRIPKTPNRPLVFPDMAPDLETASRAESRKKTSTSIPSSPAAVPSSANPFPLHDRRQEHSKVCTNAFEAHLHTAVGACDRCWALAGPADREKFKARGTHLNIVRTRSGCGPSCTLFPPADEPFRLCRKCFYSTHQQGNRMQVFRGNHHRVLPSS